MDFKIGNRPVGPGHPTYIIAELSANHGQDFDLTVRIIHAMKESGADAVKVQTYTADTMTIASDKPPFLIGGGTLWDGRTLHDLYQEAYMPWDWQPKLKKISNDLGMDFFSTPFDASAVDFLEAMDVPVHKIASFEMTDHGLLRKVAATGKPIILSTGMASLEEIEGSLAVLQDAKSGPVALLKCTSAYPADPAEMNLLTIQDMHRRFGVPIGLSDHTMGHTVPVVAVALGACIVEKHFILDRKQGGPDSTFSMEPTEFSALVDAIRITECALGKPDNYAISEKEAKSRAFRRSLFAVQDIRAGEAFTIENVRSIRPSHGMPPAMLESVLVKKAAWNIERGTPLAMEMLA
jgi:pseudaminic acid synthase